MKLFTLSLLAISILGTASAQAQTQKFLPAHKTVYYNNNEAGNWEKNSEYSYTYDSRGNITRQDEIFGSYVVRTTNEWSPENLVTMSMLQSSEDNGATFDNEIKHVYTYDPLYPEIITLTGDMYNWTDGEWTLSDGTRYDVIRDADNNVTSFTKSVTNDKGGWDFSDRYVNTVDPATKQIISSNSEFPGNDRSSANPTWYTRRFIRNIVWKETNGQVVGDIVGNVDNLISHGNKLLSATISDIIGTDTIDNGSISITYDGNGGYVDTTIYSPLSKVVRKYTIDDANGSNAFEVIDYSDLDGDAKLTDADVSRRSKHVRLYDDKGSLVEDKILNTDNESGDMEEYVGTKYDITYSTEHPDAPAEIIYGEWDSTDKIYRPYMRVTIDEYTALTTTAISNVTAAGTTNQPDRIYNIQGEAVNGSLESAPHGLYIVTRNGKTFKVMK